MIRHFYLHVTWRIPLKKIIIAPDSFKGSLDARRVCEIIAAVAMKYFPEAEIIQLPIADGGEGLVDALLSVCGGKKIMVSVQDPLGREVQSFYGLLPDGRVVIEMAAASGLPLLAENERDVMKTTTFGTGELIRQAIRKGAREIILGLGGSATNDGGAGASAALGIRYLNQAGNLILAGGELAGLAKIDTTDLMPAFKETRFLIACDVTNPLHGPMGAAHIYGPQKGALPAQIHVLDAGLKRLAKIVGDQTGIDPQSIAGSGAAGGLLVPFMAFGQAIIRKGLDVVLDTIHFDAQLENCDLVITGEGRTDGQSAMGKVLSGVGQRCKTRGIPVIAISGALDEGYEQLYESGITACFAAVRKISSLDEAMVNAERNLAWAAEDVFRLFKFIPLK